MLLRRLFAIAKSRNMTITELLQLKKESEMLKAPEFANLVEKVNNNCLPADYFRKSLFNTTTKNSVELKHKKVIYDDGKTIIKVNRSLNQKHRDLLSILMYEEKSDVQPDGKFYIKTKIYQLAKELYPNSKNAKHRIKEMLDDMRITDIEVKQNGKILNHTLLGMSYYDEHEDTYIIEVPPQTSRYLIYNAGVSIPEKTNKKIIAIKNPKLKALVTFMLSNKKLDNGIYFDTICEKLEITKPNRKSEFKKIVEDNLELLAQFKIIYKDEKFYLKKQKVEFHHALSDKELKAYELKQQKSKTDSTELQNIIGREILLQGNRYILHGIELETDTKKDNYNCYNVLLKSGNRMAILRTMYTTEENTIEYIQNKLLGVEQF